MPYLLQGGLGMPDRDYYLSDAPDMVRIRTAYRAYIADMLTLMGVPDAPARAGRIFELEMKIARAQVGAVDAQDPARVETWSRADFARRAPGIDWDAYFTAAAARRASSSSSPGTRRRSPAFPPWSAASRSTSGRTGSPSTPPAAWPRSCRAPMTICASASTAAPSPASRRSARASAAPCSPPAPRWATRSARSTSAHYFPAAARADVQRDGAQHHRRLRPPADPDRLDGAGRPAPRRGARSATLIVGVGYPDRWRDYSDASRSAPTTPSAMPGARRNSNIATSSPSSAGRSTAANGGCSRTPSTRSTCRCRTRSTSRPAILEPPFYDAHADAAFNYGAIGSVIGHEISHSFDNLGAGFDAEGRLRNWWTPADLAHFQAAGQALVAAVQCL